MNCAKLIFLNAVFSKDQSSRFLFDTDRTASCGDIRKIPESAILLFRSTEMFRVSSSDGGIMARVMISYPGNPVFQDEQVLRVTDLGLAGHLSFDALVSILNDVAARFFDNYGIKRGRNGPVGVLHTDLAVIYRAEVFYGDAVLIEAAINDIKTKGFDLVFRVTSRSNGKEIAIAKIGILFYDYSEEKAVPIPNQLVQLVKKADGKNEALSNDMNNL